MHTSYTDCGRMVRSEKSDHRTARPKLAPRMQHWHSANACNMFRAMCLSATPGAAAVLASVLQGLQRLLDGDQSHRGCAAVVQLSCQQQPQISSDEGVPAIVPHLLMREDMPTIAPWPASSILGSSPFTRV